MQSVLAAGDSGNVKITPDIIAKALDGLAERDAGIARTLRAVGYPAPRYREPGFGTFVNIIIGQQVSVASASAIRGRLDALAGPVTPQSLLALDDDAGEVRMAAARALARVGGAAAVTSLLARHREAARQDHLAIGIALSGAIARHGRDRQAPFIEDLLARAPSAARDALIESLGRLSGPRSLAALATLARGVDVDDRRKVAEVVAGRRAAGGLLVALAKDSRATVRATAVWSLGDALRVNRDVERALSRALADGNTAVAANAVASLARLASRGLTSGAALAVRLCRVLQEDVRRYVRLNAVTGLAELARHDEAATCSGGEIRRLLRSDPSWRVRRAAAGLLKTRSDARGDASDRRALRRCLSDEVHRAVAARCAAAPRPVTAVGDVLVFIVGASGDTPQPRAPFAVVLANGGLRLGVSDRRGGVLIRAAPAGPIELAPVR
jgi:hypothetical protein